MDVRIIIEKTAENGKERIHELCGLSLSSQESGSGDLGLKLEDAKALRGELQRAILYDRIEEISDANRSCPSCGRAGSLCLAPFDWATFGRVP